MACNRLFTILLLQQWFCLIGGILKEAIDLKILRVQMQLQNQMEGLRKEVKTEINFLREHVIALLGKGIATTLPPPHVGKKPEDEQKEIEDNMVNTQRFVELANKCELAIKAFGKEKEINVKLRRELSVLKDNLKEEILSEKNENGRNVSGESESLVDMMEVWKANTTRAIMNVMKSSENRTAGSLLDMLEVWKEKTLTNIMSSVNTVENRTKALSIEINQHVEMIREEQKTQFDNITVILQMTLAASTKGMNQTISKFQEDIQSDLNERCIIPLNSTIVSLKKLQSLNSDLSLDRLDTRHKEDVICSQDVKVGTLEIHTANSKENISFVCDHETDGGGWAIIYNRDVSAEFITRTWADYQKGYKEENGGITWIGLDSIQALTMKKGRELRIEILDNSR